MKNIIVICLLFFNLSSKSQSLTLDDLIGFMTKKPTTITELIVNKGWKLSSSKKIDSPDHTLLISRKVSWCYNCKQGNSADAWMYYTKELNTDIEKINGYYTTLKLDFSSLDYYNKIKNSIALKKWKMIQDEVSEDMLFKSWTQGLYTVVLTIQTKNYQQYFSLWFYTRNPEKL